ncbi:heparinase II/III family protein [Aquibacillus rhizosphaerae]|uniref:Heparinase II/III family protein n=1 Tax=Aquibacillus rhizosphaerae TaxID=3051431 RepID=A0ABT7LBC1_9BACI|nr:heparinase II/III family protein [Aquibacillus sp. LR5S19]MDL4843168.1 heparinase II/III family protein [Aquibacillus sp. LR5S19]
MNQENIMKALATSKNDDFSLLFSSNQEQENWFELIKTKAVFKPVLNEIIVEAKRLLEEPKREITYSVFKQFSQDGSRLEYEKIYFEKRRRLTTFALATVIEKGNHAYLQELHEIIWSICDEYTWCLPAHLSNSPEIAVDKQFTLDQEPTRYTIDLFASETAFALSEILQLVGNRLDPFIQQRVHQEVYHRIIWPYIHQETFEWEKATHNWAAVCAGSIGSTALHLFKNDAELAIVLERVLQTMECYLEGFNHDGTCMEGYGYWEYGFGFYVYFADLLKKRTSGTIDLFDMEKVHQIALFQQKSFLDKNRVVNFSDAQPRASVFLGLSHYLAKLYPDFDLPETELRAHFTDDHCSRWAPALRNLIWLDEYQEGHPWGDTSYFLEESQWFISRHASNHGRFAFAAKGGHNGEPHNHNDIGHFILYGEEETFLKDLGSGEYNAAYFSEERYSFLCTGSQGHSVPIINNQLQSEGKSKSAKDLSVTHDENVESIEMDIANAYTMESLDQLTRKFTWKKTAKPCLILEDTYCFSEQPTSIIERFITPILSIKEDYCGIILGDKLKIEYERDLLDLKLERIEFNNHAGTREENLALDFRVKKPIEDCYIKIAFQFR